MTLIAFLFVFSIVYLVPAYVSFWRVFSIVWLSLGALLAAFWWNTQFPDSQVDSLARKFDLAIVYSLACHWLTAALVQFFRAWLTSREWNRKYYHWPVALIGGIAAILLSAQFFIR